MQRIIILWTILILMAIGIAIFGLLMLLGWWGNDRSASPPTGDAWPRAANASHPWELVKPVDIDETAESFPTNDLNAAEWTNALGMTFIRIIPSAGSPSGNSDDTPAVEHLWVMETEVTRGQFSRFVYEAKYQTVAERNNAADIERWYYRHMTYGTNHPVANVSPIDVVEFVRWIRDRDGLSYRLMTEAEWNTICSCAALEMREGATSESPQDVRNGVPNELGLVNMCDNLSEIVVASGNQQILYDGTELDASVDIAFVVRGGANSLARALDCSWRDEVLFSEYLYQNGFRIVIDVAD